VVVAVNPLQESGSANPSDVFPVPAQSLLPTPPPNPPSAESAGVLVTRLLYAKKRHNQAQSGHSSITVPPTDVITKAVRKGAFRSLSGGAAMPHLLSVSTVVFSPPLSMAPVQSATKYTPLSVLLGTKTFLMPPMQASPKLPFMVQPLA